MIYLIIIDGAVVESTTCLLTAHICWGRALECVNGRQGRAIMKKIGISL